MTDFNQILSESFTSSPQFRDSPTESEAIFRIRVTTCHPRADGVISCPRQSHRGPPSEAVTLQSRVGPHPSPLTSHHSQVTTHKSRVASRHSPVATRQARAPLGRDRRLQGRLPMEPAIGRVLTGPKLARWAWRASTNCLLKPTPGTRVRDGVPGPRSDTPAKQWVPDGNGSRNGTAVRAQLAEMRVPCPGGSPRQPH